MSGSQKAIKVFSIIAIIGGVLAALLAVLMFVGMGVVAGETVNFDGTQVDESFIAAVAGFMFLICAVEYLVAGIFGVRGANNPQKIGPFYVICWIIVVLQVLALVVDVVSGGNDMAVTVVEHIVELIIPVILLVLANKVKKQA